MGHRAGSVLKKIKGAKDLKDFNSLAGPLFFKKKQIPRENGGGGETHSSFVLANSRKPGLKPKEGDPPSTGQRRIEGMPARTPEGWGKNSLHPKAEKIGLEC